MQSQRLCTHCVKSIAHVAMFCFAVFWAVPGKTHLPTLPSSSQLTPLPTFHSEQVFITLGSGCHNPHLARFWQPLTQDSPPPMFQLVVSID